VRFYAEDSLTFHHWPILDYNCIWGEGELVVANCVVAENTGGFSWRCGGIYSFNSNTTITNTIVRDNTSDNVCFLAGVATVSWSNIEGGWPGEGNLDVDPELISLGRFDHVPGPGSSCVDRGDPDLDDGIWDAHPRWPPRSPNGRRSDIGAYGGPGNAAWARLPR